MESSNLPNEHNNPPNKATLYTFFEHGLGKPGKNALSLTVEGIASHTAELQMIIGPRKATIRRTNTTTNPAK